MNRTSAVAVAAMLVALFAVLTALFAVFNPDVATPEARGAEFRADEAGRAMQLLVHMGLFQRFVEKTHQAAESENWPLATFYAEEIEENAEWVVEGGFVEEGVDVSALAAEVALPRAEALVAAARAGDAARYDAAYARMVDGCNACHKRSGHRFVQIQVPQSGGPSPYPSQSFAPIPGLRPEGT
ncbi:MAG TPA: hypothetical protein VF576_10850 [Rubricoccaceae bacterium]|jgi:hypothetical protein